MPKEPKKCHPHNGQGCDVRFHHNQGFHHNEHWRWDADHVKTICIMHAFELCDNADPKLNRNITNAVKAAQTEPYDFEVLTPGDAAPAPVAEMRKLVDQVKCKVRDRLVPAVCHPKMSTAELNVQVANGTMHTCTRPSSFIDWLVRPRQSTRWQTAGKQQPTRQTFSRDPEITFPTRDLDEIWTLRLAHTHTNYVQGAGPVALVVVVVVVSSRKYLGHPLGRRLTLDDDAHGRAEE